MIVVELIGGLGNQMFQYAAGRALAAHLGTELKLDIEAFAGYPLRDFTLHHLDIDAATAAPAELRAIRRGAIARRLARDAPVRHVFREASLRFDPGLFACRDGTYLKGYWQSERYFASIAEDIRREFRPREPLSPESAAVLERIRSAGPTASLHVRRGDYVTDPQTARVHGALDADYYRAAMDAIRAGCPGVRFFAFSDDPAWVEQTFRDDSDVEVVTVNGPDRGHEDMALMSACSHHIIGNSSFSWWPAWLNPSPDKRVIAPRQWFRTTDMDASDIVPEGWERL